MREINRLAVLSILLLSALIGSGKDIYVALQGTNNYPYTNWPDAATQIQWGVNASASGDRILISNGTYVLTNAVTIPDNRNITISGFTNNGSVTVDGNYSNRCFSYGYNFSCVLENLTIAHGSTNAHGGGVYAYFYDNMTVRDCVFSNNYSGSYGGGMTLYKYKSGGTNTVQRCTFVNNSAQYGGGLCFIGVSTNMISQCRFLTNIAAVDGGGLYMNGPSNVTVTACDFICNVATGSGGGALWYANANPEIGAITHCMFVSNVAGSAGGALWLSSGGYVSNCFISNNIANTSGGGIYGGVTKGIKNCLIARNSITNTGTGGNGGGGLWLSGNMQDCIMQDCIIEENFSGYFGGGVLLNTGIAKDCLVRNNVASGPSGGNGGGVRLVDRATISSCTVVSNYAKSNGGGIFDYQSGWTTSWVDNCVIYLNINGAGGIYSNYYFEPSTTIFSFSNCCLAPAVSESVRVQATNCITASPRFINPASSNYHLTRESPCVNAGINRDWMTNALDLDGRHRIDVFSRIVDIGCYEYVPGGVMCIIK